MEDFEQQIVKDLAINDTNLEGELQRQAGRYYYYGTLAAKASSKTRSQKSYLDTLKAQKSKAFKEQIAKEDPKVRVTERMLDDYLDTEEEVIRTKAELTNCQYREEVLQTALDAFRQKHYALVELLKSKETERITQNEFNSMKKEYEKQEARKLAKQSNQTTHEQPFKSEYKVGGF